MTDTTSPGARGGDNLKRLIDLYRTMVRIRAFEETALEAQHDRQIEAIAFEQGDLLWQRRETALRAQGR